MAPLQTPLRATAERTLHNFRQGGMQRLTPQPTPLYTRAVTSQINGLKAKQFTIQDASPQNTPPGGTIAVCFQNKGGYTLRIYVRGEGEDQDRCWTIYDLPLPRH